MAYQICSVQPQKSEQPCFEQSNSFSNPWSSTSNAGIHEILEKQCTFGRLKLQLFLLNTAHKTCKTNYTMYVVELGKELVSHSYRDPSAFVSQSENENRFSGICNHT